MAENVEKSEVAKKEEEILKFWQENKIFEKSLDKKGDDFVFYDGPPFATGLPHYGHILASAIKDAVPRYKTMRGFKVNRRWGWDCHGLPIENIVEKELKISGRKDIEKIGIDKFNEIAREQVLTYASEWKKTVERIGRWVDFDGSYKTMDNTYMESVWWALSEMNKKDLLYEGTRVLLYCPRCETPIAQSEIAMDNSYKDITDISVYVKFELVGESPSTSSEQPKTFVLGWTTTPWTLPGNVALAVNADIVYCNVKVEDEYIILAKNKVEEVLKDKKFEVVEEFKGDKLVGRKYQPLFDYYASDEKSKNKDKGWQVYAADFVTSEEGTGVVHIAPAFGEDDMKLALKESLPIVIHVTSTGVFRPEVTDFADKPVKPKDDHQSADVLIIKYLAAKSSLFAKKKIIHSYPHCHRCETPLYYYAIPAWFLKIQDLKPKLVELNKKINWIPDHLKHGRFEKSMLGAPDWNISRNRFWATPLPFWKCELCHELQVISSVKELKEKSVNSGNKYFVMRHGEGEHQVAGVYSSALNEYHLTEKGKSEVIEASKKIKDLGITKIICSPVLRCQETAKIIAEETGLKFETDNRLAELNFGKFSQKPTGEFEAWFNGSSNFFIAKPEEGESLSEAKNRFGNLLYEAEDKYKDEKILFISHVVALESFLEVAEGSNLERSAVISKETSQNNAEIREFIFVSLPHNKNYELDLHRPYIDQIKLNCKCGGVAVRIPEVIDCWFESGTMLFAAEHYPFAGKEADERTKSRIPADFVAEYIAQTRTWFYYMHVVSTMLFNHEPFKNVVTTGTILAADGQKMSKSKKNYPDPWELFNKYGVDTIRFYLLGSSVMKSEDLNFSDAEIREASNRIFGRLRNVLSFYEMYKPSEGKKVTKEVGECKNVLDVWILNRLAEVHGEVTKGLESYALDLALRPVDLFVDDLSVWYLRRSRERFKGEARADQEEATVILRHVLHKVAKLLAPFTPFIAEEIWQKVKIEGDEESVHLSNWAKVWEVDQQVLADMAEVRKMVSLGLEARAKAGIKVRQPLSVLKVKCKKSKISEELVELIKDEVNVKQVEFDEKLENEVELDTTITPELKLEGEARDLMRALQNWRKESNLDPKEKIKLQITANLATQDLVKKFEAEIKRVVLVTEIVLKDGESEIEFSRF